MMAVFAAGGCATFSSGELETGLRAGTEGVAVHRVAVMPVVAADPFGMEPAEQQAMLELYEAEVVHGLEELGAEVLTPVQVRDALMKAGRSDEIRRRLELNRPLELLFEPESIDERRQFEDDRKVFARELRDVLGVDALLVGQVVYHTTGRCEAGAESPYTEHVAVLGESGGGRTDVPCAISHFQAKLVDTRTGLTLWYNRVLRETRSASSESPPPDAGGNAVEAVRLVVGMPSAKLSRLIVKGEAPPSLTQREP